MSISLDRISKHFGSRILFDGVSVAFNPGNRYGLTGPNGAGKSTLLKIMMGFIEPTSGSVSLPEKVGILRQDLEPFRQIMTLDTVIMGNARLWQALQERESLYSKETLTEKEGIRLGELEEIIAEEEGYSAEAAAEELLEGAGVAKEYHNRKMHEIPTDLQFRALLCQALFGSPQALLLDEPTNHLDLESIGWLERFLHSYTGTLIVVSHDRHFLNSVTTHIADIDYDTVIIYPGNYDQMIVTKSSVRERAEAEARSKEKKIAQLKEFVARFGAGTRASQVQSRIREISRLQPQELKQSNIQRPYIRFSNPSKQPGQIVATLKGISKSYGSLNVLKNFSLEIQRGDKIAVIGGNGRGKTTLVKLIAQILSPEQGTVNYGHQVLTGYFPQNHGEVLEGAKEMNLFDWLRTQREGIYDQQIRSVLGKLLFSGEDAFKKVANLSGGESARLILASLLMHEYNFLILDEPTNHLDLESISALGWALEEYAGTLIVVSHDRDLISHFATKIIDFTSEGIIQFDGNSEAYLGSSTSSNT